MTITELGKQRAESSEFGKWLCRLAQKYDAKRVPWKISALVIATMIAWVLSGHSLRILPHDGDDCSELAKFMHQHSDAIHDIAERHSCSPRFLS